MISIPVGSLVLQIMRQDTFYERMNNILNTKTKVHPTAYKHKEGYYLITQKKSKHSIMQLVPCCDSVLEFGEYASVKDAAHSLYLFLKGLDHGQAEGN